MKENPTGLLPDGSMETYSGKHVHILRPDPDTITIEDIAHHLSLICRYNGACKFHYSVAYHSILTAHLVGEMGGTRVSQLGALLHDAPEAYTGDFIRPIKYMKGLELLRSADKALNRVIINKFGIGSANWKMIIEADNILGTTEAEQIMFSKGKGWENMPKPLTLTRIVHLQPHKVELAFLDEFRNLSIDICKMD